MNKQKLKMYMAYSAELGSHSGAFLVFAHNCREALKVSRPELQSIMDIEFTDARCSLIRGNEYLYEYADKEKLGKEIAHVIDDVPVCHKCGYWGTGILNELRVCSDCMENEKLETEIF